MPSWSSTEEGISAYLVLFLLLLAFVLVLSKLLHDKPVLSSLLPEAGMILIVGMLVGSVLTLFVDNRDKEAAISNDDTVADGAGDSVALGLLSFSPEFFFVFLLPPIIFNSGYHLRRELFFRHITPIVLLAVVGTTVSALTVTMILQFVVGMGYTGGFEPAFTELLTFGALISATDPVSTLAVFQAKRVDPHLFYLVFGESVLNDAVGLVLFKAFSKFVERDNGAGKIVMGMSEFIFGFLIDAVGSPLLGLLCGCGAAYLFKVIDMRQNPLIEISVYILIMYVPFMLAEMLQVSGIVTILFTGMTARAYVVPNLSPATAEHAQVFFRLAAHLSEVSIFLELGMSVFGLVASSLKGWFIVWAAIACLVARAANVYPIALFFNKWLREKPQDEAERMEIRHQRKAQPNTSHVEMTETLRTSDHQQGATTFENEGIVPSPTEGDQSLETGTPRFRRDLKIGFSTANMLWFSGLRGAVAYACVRSFPDTFGHQKDFILTTVAIVLFTVFFMGTTTEIVLNGLNIEMNVDEDKYMEAWHSERRSANLLLRVEEFIQRRVMREPSMVMTPKMDDQSQTTEQHYQYHVEMTESDHLERMDQMGFKRRESLFDFGGQ